ncbi:MAG: ubiquinone/menaquinone biosynthesis C-methylase UbiE [Gammaproteobacteria bacterium]|jgi:ubiquinone/menaquinone biosynthesis C-methylase UbiE
MDVHERLSALLDELGIARAHFASCLASEITPLFAGNANLGASLTLVNPNRLDPQALSGLGARLTLVTGSSGLPAGVVDAALEALGQAQILRFADYHTAAWSDIVVDRADEIANVLLERKAAAEVESLALSGAALAGQVAGISYRIQGSGPPLILLPLSLAPSQWDPVIDRLAQAFTVIRLGGAHLGMVAMLESRGSEPGYQRAVRSVFDEVAPRAGESIVELGCGSGVLARWIAHHTRGENPIVATDLNPFFLTEAAALASGDSLAHTIEFREANAEALPFPDNSVDIVFSSTVMEECDADKMLAEMIRVARPGGRVAVIVRAIDAHSICSVDVESDVKSIIEAPYRSVGEHGCADASLYRRFRESVLSHCEFFPHLLTLRDPAGAAWRYREPFFLAQLDDEQVQRWEAAKARAVQSDQFVFASGLHCAVGTKPV